MTSLERPGDRRRRVRLDADDPHRRLQPLGDQRYASDQVAAADRHHDRLHLGQIFQDLPADSGSPRHQRRVLAVLDVDEPLGVGCLPGGRVGLGDVGAADAQLGAEAADLVHLQRRASFGNHDHAAHPDAGSGVGNALPVVASRRRDHTGRWLAGLKTGE